MGSAAAGKQRHPADVLPVKVLSHMPQAEERPEIQRGRDYE